MGVPDHEAASRLVVLHLNKEDSKHLNFEGENDEGRCGPKNPQTRPTSFMTC